MNLQLFHHAVTDANQSDSDDEDSELKSSSAVVLRQCHITDRKKTGTVVMHLPDGGNEAAQTFKLTFKPDGSMSLRKKKVAVSSLQQD